MKRTILLFMAVVLLASCVKTAPPETPDITEPKQTEEITVSTPVVTTTTPTTMATPIISSPSEDISVNYGRGWAVLKDEWIYFSNPSDCFYLYRHHISNDSNLGEKQLSEEIVSYFNIVGEWIYYTSGGNIYKICADGSKRELLHQTPGIYSMYVVDDWVYYNDIEINIYKIRTDGSGETQIADERNTIVGVVGDWVCYRNYWDSFLYRIDTNGSGRELINNKVSFNVDIFDDWIYYTNAGNINKVRIDGTGGEVIIDDDSQFIVVSGDWIYYSNMDDNHYLYRICTDGTGREKLNSDASSYINVAGDWVYYIDYGIYKESVYYRIRTDGSNRQILALRGMD